MAWISFGYLDNFLSQGPLLGIILFAFWLWTLLDCTKRNFNRSWEKVIWVLVIVMFSWIGSLVYFLIVFLFKKKGLFAR
jgi:hypothetical protein